MTENELWLKRWNTLKNFLNAEMQDPDYGDCCHATMQHLDNAMQLIEQMTDENPERTRVGGSS